MFRLIRKVVGFNSKCMAPQMVFDASGVLQKLCYTFFAEYVCVLIHNHFLCPILPSVFGKETMRYCIPQTADALKCTSYIRWQCFELIYHSGFVEQVRLIKKIVYKKLKLVRLPQPPECGLRFWMAPEIVIRYYYREMFIN